MRKLLVILEAGDALPSGVVRGIIYKELFSKHGYETRFINRLSPWLVKRAMNQSGLIGMAVSLAGHLSGGKNKQSKRGFISSFIKNFTGWISSFKNRKILSIAKGYDIIYMSKVRSYELVKLLKEKTHAHIVQDFGDAIWLPGRHSNKFFDIEKFNQLLATVDAVTTDNEFTAAYARKFNKNVTPIPDYPQTHLFDKQRANFSKNKDIVTIGWIGSPNTAYNLFVVWEALEEIAKKYKNIHLRLIGTGNNVNLLPEFENVPFSKVESYNQSIMIEEVLKMDIGLFPLQNTEASRVRGILKASIYMSGEVAVMASPVGQTVDFIKDGVNGMLADTKEEWIAKMSLLIEDVELRKSISRKGLESVKNDFSLEKCFEKLTAVLDKKI